MDVLDVHSGLGGPGEATGHAFMSTSGSSLFDNQM
jgi:hypothetical protein